MERSVFRPKAYTVLLVHTKKSGHVIRIKFTTIEAFVDYIAGCRDMKDFKVVGLEVEEF